MDRRLFLARAGRTALAALLPTPFLLSAPASAQRSGATPILFVHGNGDSAAGWQTMVWRFESNGYPADSLFAFSFTDPMARDDDGVAQANRSSAADQARELAGHVAAVREATGADQIALVGHSRGGIAIRNLLTQEGAAKAVSCAVLCATPNHGVFALDALTGNEFNGRGPLLTRLNAQPDEIAPGPRWLTLRSDGQDKYAQPDGRYIGRAGAPTNVDATGPELKGATNVVLGPVDHREAGLSARAFREIYKFVAGREPERLAITPEATARIAGRITGLAGATPTNRPLADARLEIFAVAPDTGERTGPALYETRTGADGVWGPFAAPSGAPLEFVIAAAGHPTTHIYRSGLPRSSPLVDMRPARPFSPADQQAAAVVTMTRPRGYFGQPRDVVLLDGRPPADVTPGVPTDASTTLRLSEGVDRPIVALFNEERIVCRPWPARDGHVTIAELTE